MVCKVERGFTLVEVLLVVAVISILIGLLIPAVGGMRARASQTKSLANLHGIGVTMHQYHERYKSYPFMEDGQQLLFTPPDQTPALRVGISPVWDVERYWPCLMHEVAPWRENYQTWVAPGVARERGRAWLPPGAGPSDAGTGIDPSYRYSNSFLAKAATWSRDGSGEAGVAAQRADAVTFPSAKVLMFETDGAGIVRAKGEGRPVLLADGAAAAVSDATARAPVRNRLRNTPAVMYHDTEDGVRGRDR